MYKQSNIKVMKAINELQKCTSSLQSMIIMNSTDTNIPIAGDYLTHFYYTDRRSELIIEVNKNQFKLQNGAVYYVTPNGRFQYINWEGKKETDKNVRITKTNISYTDLSF